MRNRWAQEPIILLIAMAGDRGFIGQASYRDAERMTAATVEFDRLLFTGLS